MNEQVHSKLNRRTFLKALGATGIAASATGVFFLPGNLMVMANSEGYLVVDMGKCMGCNTCMITCALVHHGKTSLSLARIQIQQNPFGNWPDDTHIAICRQCENAPCVSVCPVGANHVDKEHGNVRMVNTDRCIGCMQCIAACPWIPKRLQWDQAHRKAQKCDLCKDTPYMKEKGGPGGVQACVKVCPMHAIVYFDKMPDQKEYHSYEVNLRGRPWSRLGGSSEDLHEHG